MIAYASSHKPSTCIGENAKQTYPHPTRADTDISHVLRRSAAVLYALARRGM